ncbi:unnamed protein product [Ilex paraguariensis]|uniref:SHSP domain-containing protein n=1 Tax=Ilex paraguariensis TaxID=185542 RepID=A0ABC8UFJ7_9AQUA
MSITPSFGVRRRNFYDNFPLDDWDPFKDFHFQSSLSTAPHGFPSTETTSFVNARIDWNETPEAHVFKIELPGLSKNEVKVQVEDGKVVKISGESNTEKEEKDGEWHRVERSSVKFLRAIRLPENGRAEKVKSSMENGVLTVTVPKRRAKERQHVKLFK